jgi:hypothetical protein
MLTVAGGSAMTSAWILIAVYVSYVDADLAKNLRLFGSATGDLLPVFLVWLPVGMLVTGLWPHRDSMGGQNRPSDGQLLLQGPWLSATEIDDVVAAGWARAMQEARAMGGAEALVAFTTSTGTACRAPTGCSISRGKLRGAAVVVFAAAVFDRAGFFGAGGAAEDEVALADGLVHVHGALATGAGAFQPA